MHTASPTLLSFGAVVQLSAAATAVRILNATALRLPAHMQDQGGPQRKDHWEEK
jgi:hypothetical protein